LRFCFSLAWLLAQDGWQREALSQLAPLHNQAMSNMGRMVACSISMVNTGLRNRFLPKTHHFRNAGFTPVAKTTARSARNRSSVSVGVAQCRRQALRPQTKGTVYYRPPIHRFQGSTGANRQTCLRHSARAVGVGV
jgi:hypothetical protein